MSCKRCIGPSSKRELTPRWHEETWSLAWKLVLDSRTLGSRSDHVGVVDPKVNMA